MRWTFWRKSVAQPVVWEDPNGRAWVFVQPGDHFLEERLRLYGYKPVERIA